MIRKFTITVVAGLFFLVFGMMSSASAIPIVEITPDTKEGYFEDGVLAPPTQSNIESYFKLDDGALGSLLYKVDVENDGSVKEDDDAPFAGSYTTKYSLKPEILTITWTYSNDFISGSPIYLFVKDGVHGNYLFNLSNLYSNVIVDGKQINKQTGEGYAWDGMATLRLSEFWPDQGDAISHVSIWGESTPVPEPGMVILLGIGLLGLLFFNRMRLVNK